MPEKKKIIIESHEEGLSRQLAEWFAMTGEERVNLTSRLAAFHKRNFTSEKTEDIPRVVLNKKLL